jgi:hypothetical protein
VRRWRLVIGGPAILLLMGVVVSLAAGAQEDPIDQGLTGPQLAEALGLEPVTENVVKGCNYFAEAGDVGYCLDSAVRDGLDPSQLYALLNKEPFTETEARIAQIQDEIWRLGSDLRSRPIPQSLHVFISWLRNSAPCAPRPIRFSADPRFLRMAAREAPDRREADRGRSPITRAVCHPWGRDSDS